MIKRIECFASTELGNMSIGDIRDYVRHKLREDIVLCDLPKLDTLESQRYHVWLNDTFCNKKNITINDKNIEYSEDFWIVKDWGDDTEFSKARNRYEIDDVFVTIFVFRVGSYSYWAAVCSAMTGNEPMCE